MGDSHLVGISGQRTTIGSRCKGGGLADGESKWKFRRWGHGRITRSTGKSEEGRLDLIEPFQCSILNYDNERVDGGRLGLMEAARVGRWTNPTARSTAMISGKGGGADEEWKVQGVRKKNESRLELY